MCSRTGHGVTGVVRQPNGAKEFYVDAEVLPVSQGAGKDSADRGRLHLLESLPGFRAALRQEGFDEFLEFDIHQAGEVVSLDLHE
jgi:hypothetical protein